MIVYSWDNLSSKGLLHEPPDRLFVWNELQAREAVELHGLDPATVEVDRRAPLRHVLRAAAVGRPGRAARGGRPRPGRRTILYLGLVGVRDEVASRSSSTSGSRAPRLRRPSLRNANVLVRPHPGASDEPAWTAWAPEDGVASPPRSRARGRSSLFDQLFVADAVVALNTSAELEAAIVGRPVLTVTVGDLRPRPGGLARTSRTCSPATAASSRTAGSLDEHVPQLAGRSRTTRTPTPARRFVESFLRPRGLDRPAGPELADAIERLAVDG